MTADYFLADFIAGCVAGGAGLLIGHPLDTIKVRLQALQGYNGAMQCIRQTMRREAFVGFYKGMMFPFVSAGFLHSIYFGGYGVMLKRMKKDAAATDPNHGKQYCFHHILTASIFGAFCQWIPACPIEIVKTKLQVQKEQLGVFHIWHHTADGKSMHAPSHHRHGPGHGQRYFRAPHTSSHVVFTGSLDCVRKTWRHEGVWGFYRGGLTMLARDGVGFCFYLPVYEFLMNIFLSRREKMRRRDAALSQKDGRGKENDCGEELVVDRNHPLSSLIAGGMAGVGSWLPILPLDLIKSRLQADDIVRPKYEGMWHCAKTTYRNEGAAAFYKGWQIVALRAFPVNAVLFLCYEQTVRLLDQSAFIRWDWWRR